MDNHAKDAKDGPNRSEAAAPARRPKPERELSIREMAETHGVTLRTLRYYELRGLLAPRRDGRVRFYSAEDSARLKNILSGKEFGFTLAEISDSIRAADAKKQFAEALPEKTILAQLDYLEDRRRDLNKAIARLRAIHRQAARDEERPPEAAAEEWPPESKLPDRKGAA